MSRTRCNTFRNATWKLNYYLICMNKDLLGKKAKIRYLFWGKRKGNKSI